MRRKLLVLALIAFTLTLAYAAYVQPGWEAWRDDQRQYLLLAEGLAQRGEFTRAPAGQPFVPEPLRTPGYPLLLAPLCATVGCGHWQVAIAQALVAATLPFLAYLLARRWGRGFGFACAVACAVYLPFAYYAALALADLAATALMLVGLVLASRARTMPAAFGAGTVFGLLALTRPQFVLFVVAVALAFALAREPGDLRARLRPALALMLGTILVLAPLSIYSARYFGAPFASSSGTGLWWGYFQGIGGEPGPVAEFRRLALANAAEDTVISAGATIGLDPLESREAAAALREISSFNGITDRATQSSAWIDLNRSLTTRALRLIASDPVGYLSRGLTVRTIELWAGELPIRVDDFHELPTEPRALSAAAQLVLFAFGVAGAVLLARTRELTGLLVAGTVGYTWVALVVFVTEPRYSLPARSALLVAALFATVSLARRGHKSSAVSQSESTGAPA